MFNKGKIIQVPKSPKIVAYFDGEKYFAFNGICPHAKWPLELGSVKDCTLTCGGHGWEFNIDNGKCLTNPGRDLKSFRIRDEGDKIIISSENDEKYE